MTLYDQVRQVFDFLLTEPLRIRLHRKAPKQPEGKVTGIIEGNKRTAFFIQVEYEGHTYNHTKILSLWIPLHNKRNKLPKPKKISSNAWYELAIFLNNKWVRLQEFIPKEVRKMEPQAVSEWHFLHTTGMQKSMFHRIASEHIPFTDLEYDTGDDDDEECLILTH